MNISSVIQSAQKTITMQAESVAQLASLLGDGFEKAVACLLASSGRVVVSGIGKSAIIAQKIVATLNSTGTPAVFMHAADAIHGDLGMVQQQDVLLLISKSGDSPEIKVLVPLIKNFGNTLIGMVGNTQSFLALHSDVVINCTVTQEACPNNLAPTNSTTAQMVMGDALAICLMEQRGFGSADFARVHPGGALGKRLYLRAGDLAKGNEKPAVPQTASIPQVIVEITKKRLGATIVTDENGEVAGIITDGDLRRMLEKNSQFDHLQAKDIMGKQPKTIDADVLAVEAMDSMRHQNISQLVVMENGAYAGLIHLHDLMREGIL